MLLNRLFAAILALGSVAAVVVPSVAEATPGTAWRTRNTGLDSVGKCTRRAFHAVKNANLEGKASGESGVYGSNGQGSVTILCLQNGASVAVFCTADPNVSSNIITSVCDSVSRQMDK